MLKNTSPRGGIGRHKGLKILALFGSAGSSPAEGTIIIIYNKKDS